MRGRKWRGTAAFLLGLLGILIPRAHAQEAVPIAWPPIDVWGVSGHPIGAIRLVQPTLNGLLRYSLVAEFVPADAKTLAELAAKLWPGAQAKCLHFNWIQVTLNSGRPPLPVNAAGLPLNPPFLDPPVGGYQGDSKPADALPWFLDETPYVPKKSADMNIYNTSVVLPDVLRWYMKPYSATPPDVMQYDTVLVLINDCTGQYEPLGGFHWTATFPAGGAPKFAIMPFGPKETFAHGDLVAAFTGNAGPKQKARSWTIRPLVKP